MQKLSKTIICGDQAEINEMRKIFGDIYLGRETAPEIFLTLTNVFSNIYRSSIPKKENGDLIYILVPNENITSVWSGEEVDETRFGVAKWNGKDISQAIAFHKGNKTLYLCLANSGMLIDACVGPGGLGI